MAEWLLYEHDDGRQAVTPSAEAATFAHGDPAWHRVGPVEVHLSRPVAPGDLDPRTALAYAKRMKDYCEAFDGRDWVNVMIHGSPDEQNLAHALDNLTECAAMLMNMAGRVADGVKVRYIRKPEADKRTSRGDDFAGDAWLDTETGETVYTVVGFDRNQQPTMIVQDGKAVSTAGVRVDADASNEGGA